MDGGVGDMGKFPSENLSWISIFFLSQGRSQDFREGGGGADQSVWVACISTPKLGGRGSEGMLPQEVYNLGDCFCWLLRLLLVLRVL